jgi:hypothetical protein
MDLTRRSRGAASGESTMGVEMDHGASGDGDGTERVRPNRPRSHPVDTNACTASVLLV